MEYNNKELLIRITKSKAKRSRLTHITDKSKLSIEDKIKMSLCKHFVQFINVKKIKIKDLSELTRIPSSRISEIINYKIKKFTVDQLIKNLKILSKYAPSIREYLLFVEQAVEIPTLKVEETRRLTKELKVISLQGFVGNSLFG